MLGVLFGSSSSLGETKVIRTNENWPSQIRVKNLARVTDCIHIGGDYVLSDNYCNSASELTELIILFFSYS